jgi:DNA-binding response OmpR family regulator
MAKERILIVEDEKNISKLLRYNLEKAEYDCTVARTGEDAIEILKKQRTDLIILDIMLPGMDGFEVCRRVRQDTANKGTPIIMLTAKGEEVDRVVGLELGADDYMVKPFSPRELVLRVKVVLKRGKPEKAKKDLLISGGLTVDIPRHKVTVNKKEVPLTPMEFKLLVTLLERQDRVQTREQLLSDVWGIDATIETRTIDTHVKSLRSKLGKIGKYIETVTGMGYRYKDEYED